MDQQAEKNVTERVTGLGVKTRQQIIKWNDSRQGTDIAHPRPPYHVESTIALNNDKCKSSDCMHETSIKIVWQGSVQQYNLVS